LRGGKKNSRSAIGPFRWFREGEGGKKPLIGPMRKKEGGRKTSTLTVGEKRKQGHKFHK